MAKIKSTSKGFNTQNTVHLRPEKGSSDTFIRTSPKDGQNDTNIHIIPDENGCVYIDGVKICNGVIDGISGIGGEFITQDQLDSLVIRTSGDTLDGVVHITDIMVTGNVSLEYLEETNNQVIDAFTSDQSNITLELTSRTFTDEWLPKAEISIDNGPLLSISKSYWTEDTNGKFKAQYPVSLSGGSGVIRVGYFSGSEHEINYNIASNGPSVLTANLGVFPALSWDNLTNQTTLKQGDVVEITGTCESTTTYIEVVDETGAIFSSGNVSITEGQTTFSISAVVSNRTGVNQIRLRARNSLGTFGNIFSGSTAILDQIEPNVVLGAIDYPVGQGAIKNNETATINYTLTNFESFLAQSLDSDLNNISINSSSAEFERINGDYNDNSYNFRIIARKDSNGTENSSDGIIVIANVAAVIDVNVPFSRLRSGGNDGTAAPEYTITATSNQTLGSFDMDNQTDYGVFLDSWDSIGGKTWTRGLEVSDNHQKGAGTFTNVNAVNLSGIPTTVINSGSVYTLGGFVSRDLTLLAFANTVNANVDTVDYSKVTLSWSVKSLTNKRAFGTTAVPDPNSWSLTSLSPTSVIILDTVAASSSSQSSTVTIEEVI